MNNETEKTQDNLEVTTNQIVTIKSDEEAVTLVKQRIKQLYKRIKLQSFKMKINKRLERLQPDDILGFTRQLIAVYDQLSAEFSNVFDPMSPFIKSLLDYAQHSCGCEQTLKAA